ncbi:MAG: DegQ family serine endoprotease [Deltaproteobacteria bacterium]|nr:DegQ family serine endoprotease [Deltaproteobacteria bacterium]
MCIGEKQETSQWIRVLLLGLVLAVAFNLFCTPVLADESAGIRKTSRAFTEIAKKAMPTVVFISVEKTIEAGRGGAPFQFNNPFDLFNDDFFERFFGYRYPHMRPRKYKQMGMGSGFIISKDGYILTNHQSDVALIRIKADGDLPVLPLGNSDALEVGEWVMAIGNPFGLSHTLTVGVVSAKGRTTVGITDYEDFIQTDAAINPGNSGGPLINMKGQAVGINSAIFSKSGGYMGIGFAIPINMVKAIKNQLIEHGKVQRGYLGVSIQALTEDLMKSFHLKETQGVLISDVTKDSAADKAGLRRGDVVVEYDHKPVKDPGHFRNMVALTPPGTKVEIGVIRSGKKKVVTAVLGSLEETRTAAVNEKQLVEKLGFTVQELTEDLARQFGYEGKTGVLISQVAPGTPAQFAGLRPGMLILEVNRKQVKSVREFFDAFRGSKSVLLLVQYGPYARYVILQVQ